MTLYIIHEGEEPQTYLGIFTLKSDAEAKLEWLSDEKYSVREYRATVIDPYVVDVLFQVPVNRVLEGEEFLEIRDVAKGRAERLALAALYLLNTEVGRTFLKEHEEEVLNAHREDVKKFMEKT